MLETLRAWLNGTRNYDFGAAIYNKIGADERLKPLFNNGFSNWNNWKLQEELTVIFKELKKEKKAVTKPKYKGKPATTNHQPPTTNKKNAPGAETIVIPNPQLYAACKLEADLLYKEKMNKRAVLFSMVPSDKYSDPNRPDLVTARSRLCIEVVDLDQRSSRLYERADYVKEHGRLPNDVPAPDDEHAFEDLPDHQVKQTLDNLRKNYNKMKNRPQTAERVLLMQKHEKNIKLLESKWLLLKPQK